MFELWFTALYSVWLVALAYLTYIGLVELIKLKLKSIFLYAIGLWILSAYILTSLLELLSVNIRFALGGLGLETLILAQFIAYREHDRASSIHQLLKKLPLRDRLLGRIPESLLKEPLPPPIPPRISFKLWLTFLILPVAIGCIIYGYILSIEASWTFPIDIPGHGTVDVPLPPAIHAGNWYPLFFLSGIFLFIAAVLIIKKHQRIGAIIALIFSAITIFEGRLLSILLGVIGISGGILAFAESKANDRRNFIEESSMANTSGEDE